VKELKAPDKVLQQMTRDGAIEVNKATGGAEGISARETGAAQAAGSVTDPGGAAIAGAADRVMAERRAIKKKAVRKANAEIYKHSRGTPGSTRLRFTDEERSNPAMAKTVRRSDKAADRFEKAKSKTIKGKALPAGRVSDKPAGKPDTRLYFRERETPPNGKLQHGLSQPAREAALLVHSEVRKSDNSGVQAAHSTGRAAGSAARRVGQGYRSIKLQPQRAALRAEEKAVKANANALYERSLRLNPELQKANPISKMIQKQRIKKEYPILYRAARAETEHLLSGRRVLG